MMTLAELRKKQKKNDLVLLKKCKQISGKF